MLTDWPLLLGLIALVGMIGYITQRNAPDVRSSRTAETGWQLSEDRLLYLRLDGNTAMLMLICEKGQALFKLVAPDGAWADRVRSAAFSDTATTVSIYAALAGPWRPERDPPVAMISMDFPNIVLRDLQSGRLSRLDVQIGARRRYYSVAQLPAKFMRSRWFEACNVT
ncbi:MAG: hypothetical protein AAF577_05695 [Pseudomonadota bacterium]